MTSPLEIFMIQRRLAKLPSEYPDNVIFRSLSGVNSPFRKRDVRVIGDHVCAIFASKGDLSAFRPVDVIPLVNIIHTYTLCSIDHYAQALSAILDIVAVDTKFDAIAFKRDILDVFMSALFLSDREAIC